MINFPHSLGVILILAMLGISSLRDAPAAEVSVIWDANPEPDIAGYRVYRGMESGIFPDTVDVGKMTTATLTNLIEGTTYYCVVTAYNTAGLESLPSAEISFTASGGSDGSGGNPLQVSFSTPVSGSEYAAAPATIVSEVIVSGGDNAVTRVEFYAASDLIGQATSAPYVLTWSNVAVGTYSLMARAFDSSGGSADSAPVMISVSVPPLSAPSALVSTAVSQNSVALAWSDNSTAEDGFKLQRKPAMTTEWSDIATLGADVRSYSDFGLDPGKTFAYRVRAFNAQIESAFSNEVVATTDPLPPVLDQWVSWNLPVLGVVTGTYIHTRVDDGFMQSITEVESGGKPTSRHSLLEHIWIFDLHPGVSSTLIANIYSGGSSDGDAFQFDLSFDGGTSWQPLFTVSSTDPANFLRVPLPSGGGSLQVRVRDTDRAAGNRSLDTVFIDQLYVHTETVATTAPPAAPDGMAAEVLAGAEVNLTWIDRSDSEIGFEVECSVGDGLWEVIGRTPNDVASFTDGSAASGRAYRYRVHAFNAAGTSANSNEVSVTMPVGIVLNANASKAKGKLLFHLSWLGAVGGAQIDVYRNSALIANVTDADSYTDETDFKAGVSLYYQVVDRSTGMSSNQILVDTGALSAGGTVTRQLPQTISPVLFTSETGGRFLEFFLPEGSRLESTEDLNGIWLPVSDDDPTISQDSGSIRVLADRSMRYFRARIEN
ncbi:MAG: fibronectin type III domain-containing protein [Verrucomicrobiales bacterium]